jgi:hypothetical protein
MKDFFTIISNDRFKKVKILKEVYPTALVSNMMKKYGSISSLSGLAIPNGRTESKDCF